MNNQTSAKWAVSKNRNNILSKNATSSPGDTTSRFEFLSNLTLTFEDENEVVHEVVKLWREAQDRFLTIGRYLLQAKSKFHRTYEATILPQLPFGKGVAYQLRAVATAVDDGKLLEEELPQSYATAYQLVSLSSDDLEKAREENLVRKDVLRREVELFRVNLREARKPSDPTALLREKKSIEQKIASLSTRLDEINKHLSFLKNGEGVAP